MQYVNWTQTIVLFSVFAQPAFLWGEDSPNLDHLDSLSISELFDKLVESPQNQRNELRAELNDRYITLIEHFVDSDIPEFQSVSVIQEPAENLDPALSKKWLQEAEELAPRFIAFLRKEPADEWSPVIEMLLLTDPEANFLEQHRNSIVTNPNKRWTLLGMIVSVGCLRLPRDQSCLEALQRELKELSPKEHLLLEQLWDSGDSKNSGLPVASLFGPTTAGIAIMFATCDRVQVELPFLGKLISPQYPNVVRLMSLTVISELELDAAPLLPVLHEQLEDADLNIRLQAACAIVAVAPEEADIAKILEHANLPGEQKDSIDSALRGFVEESKELDEYVKEGDEYIKSMMLESFRSGHQFYIRQSLRNAIQMKSNASFIQEEVERVLELDNLDTETKRLAILALKAIQDE